LGEDTEMKENPSELNCIKAFYENKHRKEDARSKGRKAFGEGRDKGQTNQSYNNGGYSSDKPSGRWNSNQANNSGENNYVDEDDDLTSDDIANSAFANKNKGRTETTKGKNTKATEDKVAAETTSWSQVRKKKHNFGILFSKIGPSNTTEVYSGDMEQLVHCIFECDPEAYLLPHNNSSVGAVSKETFSKMKGMDYTKFFNLGHTAWGSRIENKKKIAFSCYITSDVLTEDLKMIREHTATRIALREQNVNMARHKLLESLDASIGFFLGKTQEHTYRGEMEQRLQTHLQSIEAKQIAQENGKQESQGENTELPPLIPLSAKLRTIQHEDIQAEVVKVFVGAKDESRVKSMLQKEPFPVVKIVPYEYRRQHEDQWKKHLEIHNILVSNSAAIKIMDANERFRGILMRHLEEDKATHAQIIDITRRMTTAPRDILYKNGIARRSTQVGQLQDI
jgi:hypothetical protein